MRAVAAAALAITTVVAPFSTGPASAAPDPTGPSCGLAAADDQQIPLSLTGTLFGGPLVLRDGTDPTGTYNGRIVCTVQTGTNDTHAEADGVSVEGAVDGPVTAAAGTVTFFRGYGELVHVCTSVALVGRPDLYWDAVTGAWSTSSSVPCELATTYENEDVPVAADALDAILCPILRVVLPPDGDIPLLFDCPPEGDGEILQDATLLAWVVPRPT